MKLSNNKNISFVDMNGHPIMENADGWAKVSPVVFFYLKIYTDLLLCGMFCLDIKDPCTIDQI